MEYKYYERKINDVICKCPIEAGIEILVYNLLDEHVDMNEFSLVNINRIWKKSDSRLLTDGGVPDIAILSIDFIFGQENIGEVYGLIEIKSAGTALRETEQILGHSKKVPHFIFTNGVVWRYYHNHLLEWEINLSSDGVKFASEELKISEKDFYNLKNKLNIPWNES